MTLDGGAVARRQARAPERARHGRGHRAGESAAACSRPSSGWARRTRTSRAAASGWRCPSGWWKARAANWACESELGVGTTFWVDLPVAAAPLADASRRCGWRSFCWATRSSDRGEDGSGTAGRTGHSRARARPPRTVLHIEDNEPNRRLVEMLVLQRPALRLLTASRGQRGPEARARAPPGFDPAGHAPAGHARARACCSESARRTRRTRDTPVVMVSADAAAMRRNQEASAAARTII